MRGVQGHPDPSNSPPPDLNARQFALGGMRDIQLTQPRGLTASRRCHRASGRPGIMRGCGLHLSRASLSRRRRQHSLGRG